MPVNKFIHIHTVDSFPKSFSRYRERNPTPDEIVYEGTVKLHGTNLGYCVLRRPSFLSDSRS